MKQQRYLLDTNICAFILRGKYRLNERVEAVGGMENCCISEVTIAELKYGDVYGKLKGGPKYRGQKLEDFLDNIKVLRIMPYFDAYAEERARLELAGTRANDSFDLLIGCTSVEEGMVMVTENVDDFKNIRGIKIENWVDRTKK